MGPEDQKHTIRLYDALGGKLIRQVVLPQQSKGSSLVFSPDGAMLAWASKDRRVHLVETLTGKHRHAFAGHRDIVSSLAFAPDGRTLASGSQDTTVILWDIATLVGADKTPLGQLPPVELDRLWLDLASGNAVVGYQAMCKLRRAPEQALGLLKRITAAAAPDARARVAQLLAELENEQFAVRQKAVEELESLGDPIQPALEKALAASKVLDVQRQLIRLLEKIAVAPPPEQMRALRAVEVLEGIGGNEAGQLLAILAKGTPQSRLTRQAKAALMRLRRL